MSKAILPSLLEQYQHYDHKMQFLLRNFGPPQFAAVIAAI
jgi:hypothetical protein